MEKMFVYWFVFLTILAGGQGQDTALNCSEVLSCVFDDYILVDVDVSTGSMSKKMKGMMGMN